MEEQGYSPAQVQRDNMSGNTQEKNLVLEKCILFWVYEHKEAFSEGTE